MTSPKPAAVPRPKCAPHADAAPARPEVFFDAARAWRDIFDYLTPLLRLTLQDLALYFYLLRRTHLDGQLSALLSWNELSAALFTSRPAIRQRLYRLVRKGCLRVHDPGHGRPLGNRLEIFSPQELILSRTLRSAGVSPASSNSSQQIARPRSLSAVHRLSGAITFRATPAVRFAFWQREHGRCFYCGRALANPLRAPSALWSAARQRRRALPDELAPNSTGPSRSRAKRSLRSAFQSAAPPHKDFSRSWAQEKSDSSAEVMWLDHVVSITQGGSHGMDNIVAACRSCNRSKRISSPEAFLERLFRAERITRPQYRYRLAAVRRIRAGSYPLPGLA